MTDERADAPRSMIASTVADGAGSSRRARLNPGMFLETRFLHPLHLSQDALAKNLGISRRRVNEIVRGRRGISADTAVRLGRYFGTGPDFWLSLQHSWDTYKAFRKNLRQGTRQLDRRDCRQTARRALFARDSNRHFPPK
jgi:antitoxin HigA-1